MPATDTGRVMLGGRGTVLGVASIPVVEPSWMAREWSRVLTMATSGTPSLLKSAAATYRGPGPVGDSTGAAKVAGVAACAGAARPSSPQDSRAGVMWRKERMRFGLRDGMGMSWNMGIAA